MTEKTGNTANLVKDIAESARKFNRDIEAPVARMNQAFRKLDARRNRNLNPQSVPHKD